MKHAMIWADRRGAFRAALGPLCAPVPGIWMMSSRVRSVAYRPRGLLTVQVRCSGHSHRQGGLHPMTCRPRRVLAGPIFCVQGSGARDPFVSSVQTGFSGSAWPSGTRQRRCRCPWRARAAIHSRPDSSVPKTFTGSVSSGLHGDPHERLCGSAGVFGAVEIDPVHAEAGVKRFGRDGVLLAQVRSDQWPVRPEDGGVTGRHLTEHERDSAGAVRPIRALPTKGALRGSW